ncbi:MAG: flavin reductase family protein [Methanomassiliicoccales archaeon]|nr:flavin reductase family protein [Methanomassiliicoccales archaeon]
MNTSEEKNSRGAVETMNTLLYSPVVFVGIGKKDLDIITVGMFDLFSFRRPIISIGVTASGYGYKLAEENDDFSVDFLGIELVDKVVCCGSKPESKVNKFEACALTPVPGFRIKSPKIEECIMNGECKKIESFEKGDYIWFPGQIIHGDVTADYDQNRALLRRDGIFWSIGNQV